MAAVIPPAVVEEILRKVAASDRSTRALDAIATEYGLMLAELRQLTARTPLQVQPIQGARNQNLDSRPSAPPAAPAVETRTCSACKTTKPLSEYYKQANGPGGHMSQCPACHNDRPPTEARMIRNRARSRATKRLIELHRDEFEVLLEREAVKAQAEHERLKAAAAAKGAHDASTARLRPGPKREGQTAAERLDVARCVHCHTHHDANHECPSCGDTTPEHAPSVKPYVMREWALAQGMSPVPHTGPLPKRIRNAYLEAHGLLPEQTQGVSVKVLIRRPGSGQVVHHAKEHGVSSYKLGCGRVTLRSGVRTVTDGATLPPGTSECPKCQGRAS